jgi:hypothetical protein
MESDGNVDGDNENRNEDNIMGLMDGQTGGRRDRRRRIIDNDDEP